MKNTKIQQGFDRAAVGYDEVALIHQKIGQNLLQRLADIELQPKRILDLGCGTGYFSQQLQQRYPQAEVVGIDFSAQMVRIAQENYPQLNFIVADAHATGLESYQFDLIFCNNLLHWTEVQSVLIEVKRLLALRGLFLFSTWGPDTLRELRQAWQAVGDGRSHVNDFMDMHNLGDGIKALNYMDPVLDTEIIEVAIPDVYTLMHSLKAMGASFSYDSSFVPKAAFQILQENYPKKGDKSVVTCEVIYGHARQAEKLNTQGVNEAGVVNISVEQLLASRNPKS